MITGPLWRKLEQPSISIADMSIVYQELCTAFSELKSDCSALLDGSARMFSNVHIIVDEVHQELFCSNDTDASTQVILELFVSAFANYSTKLLADHLPGGKFSNMSAQQQSTTASVRTTNVASERAFALLDRLQREKPNASTIAIEGIVLFCCNRTGEWLRSQSSLRRRELFKSALAGAQHHRQLYQQRSQAIRDFQRERMIEKERQRQQKEAHTLQEKQQLVDSIALTGLWSTPDTVAEKLALLPTAAAKLAALKKQVRFRRVVLQQQGDKILFQWSSGGKAFTWEELGKHLLQLIREARTVEE
eukprot:scpid76657/ scgid31214/ 